MPPIPTRPPMMQLNPKTVPRMPRMRASAACGWGVAVGVGVGAAPYGLTPPKLVWVGLVGICLVRIGLVGIAVRRFAVGLAGIAVGRHRLRVQAGPGVHRIGAGAVIWTTTRWSAVRIECRHFVWVAGRI